MLIRPTSLAGLTILALAALAACNGSVNTGTGGNGGSGSTTSSTTSMGTAGAGGGADCSAFDDQPGAKTVTFSFTNQGSAPVFMPGGCIRPYYSLKFLAPDDAQIEIAYENVCLQTCEDLQTQGPIECGPCPQSIYKIDPGQTLQVPWDGTTVNAETMPASCYGPGGPQTSCNRIETAAQGDYLVTATVFQQCNGPCTCDSNGLCQGSTAGMAGTAFKSFSLPSDSAAEVVFDGCIFGCP